MSEERKQELLTKITKFASNDATTNDSLESDIKVTHDSESGNILVDTVAHWMKTDENEPERMNISYAASKCAIKNASIQ